MTSMYDAEYGRASGVIVNAVSKSGTNQFRGVMFLSAASNALTAEDFLVKQNNLAKPVITKRDWGGVLGGPIIRNKAHFFLSLERQVDNPTRTGVFPTRPELNFSIVEKRSGWNTMFRFDHQINGAHTWAVRYLRESAPQFPIVGARQTLESVSDETDIDHTAVGTLTSVFGNARVNTIRIARTWEHWWHGNECSRALGDERAGPMTGCPPQLDFPSFLTQASTEAQGPWDSNYQIEDDFSWFVPGKKGDHELKFGARYNYTELMRVSQINQNGTFRFNGDLPYDAANPRTYPERLTIRVGEFEEKIDNHTVELYAQDKWKVGRTTLSAGIRYDLEIIPIDQTDNPLFPAGNKKSPVDRNNIAPTNRGHPRAGRRGSVGRAGWLRDLLQPNAARSDRRHDRVPQVHLVGRGHVPERQRRPGPGRRPFAHRSVSGQRALPQHGAPQPALPAWDADAERRGREIRFPRSEAALRASGHGRLRSRDGEVDRRPGRLHSHGEQGHVPRTQPQPHGAGRTRPAPARLRGGMPLACWASRTASRSG